MATASVPTIRRPAMTKAKTHWTAMVCVVIWPNARAVERQYLFFGQGWKDLTERQHCELKAHCVVLEDQEVESTNSQDAPDENVGNDSGGQASSIDGSCSVPKNGDIRPS